MFDGMWEFRQCGANTLGPAAACASANTDLLEGPGCPLRSQLCRAGLSPQVQAPSKPQVQGELPSLELPSVGLFVLTSLSHILLLLK